MPGYIIANVDWIHPEAMEAYGELAYPTLVAAGGKILAASEQPEIIEGNWGQGIVVLIEFPSATDARRLLDSAVYQPARQVRQNSADSNLILLES